MAIEALTQHADQTAHVDAAPQDVTQGDINQQYDAATNAMNGAPSSVNWRRAALLVGLIGAGATGALLTGCGFGVEPGSKPPKITISYGNGETATQTPATTLEAISLDPAITQRITNILNGKDKALSSAQFQIVEANGKLSPNQVTVDQHNFAAKAEIVGVSPDGKDGIFVMKGASGQVAVVELPLGMVINGVDQGWMLVNVPVTTNTDGFPPVSGPRGVLKTDPANAVAAYTDAPTNQPTTLNGKQMKADLKLGDVVAITTNISVYPDMNHYSPAGLQWMNFCEQLNLSGNTATQMVLDAAGQGQNYIKLITFANGDPNTAFTVKANASDLSVASIVDESDRLVLPTQQDVNAAGVSHLTIV